MSTAGPPRATVSLRGFTPPRCQRKEPLRVAHPRRFTGPAGLRRGTRRLVLQAGVAIRLLRGGSRGAKWAAYVKNEYTMRAGTFAARPWLRSTQTSGPQKKADYGALWCKNRLSSDGGVTWSRSLPLMGAPAKRGEQQREEATARFFSRRFVRKNQRNLRKRSCRKRCDLHGLRSLR